MKRLLFAVLALMVMACSAGPAHAILIDCPTCSIVSTAGPTPLPTVQPTPAPTVQPTVPPTPSPAPTAPPPIVSQCPSAPALSNQQTFQPGASFGGARVAGDGVTDDTGAMQQALNAGDVFVIASHVYNFVAGNLSIPGGRKLYCQDHTAVLQFLPSGSGLKSWGTLGGSNWISNCRFAGPYASMHNQVPSPGYDGCNGGCPSGGRQSSTGPWTAGMFLVGWNVPNVTILASDFDGIGGYNGAVELGTTSGTCSHNWRVCGNSFESSGLVGVEIACGYSNRIDYNVFNNSGADEEGWPSNQGQVNSQIQHNTIDHNVFHWRFGAATNNNGWCGLEVNRLMSDMVHMCSGCTTAGATSMSTNVISNNVIDSPSGSVGGIAGCTNKPCGLDCGILSQHVLGRATLQNNTITGVCGICNQ